MAGRYTVHDTLGRGGMGTVYRVTDELSGQDLALKRLNMDTGERSTSAALFEREYHTLSQLKHPHMVRVYDYGVDVQGPYYTMELVGGSDLRTVAPLPYGEVCRYGRDVASCLALLHAHRMVHRDISPTNVRLTPLGAAKLIDFGALATIGVSARVVGTPPGIAPEALNGLPLDHRVDLFALGALLYWALTGQHAYPAKRVGDLTAVWRMPPHPPSYYAPEVPRALDELVRSMLSLNPMARPASAAEVIEHLEVIAGLESESSMEEAPAHIVHCALVGRDVLVQGFRDDVRRLEQGHGGATLVEGGAGMGKSRLLGEILVQAQLRGVTTVQVDGGQGEQGEFALAAALTRRLLDVVGRPAERAVARHAPVLTHILPDLMERVPRPPPEAVELPDDPAERRALTQSALTEWFFELSAETPLLILVDDAHRADSASAFLLAAMSGLVEVHPMNLVMTFDREEEPLEPHAMDALQEFCRSVRLRPLEVEHVTMMVRGAFGDVSRRDRLTEWLYRLTQGNPWQVVTLLQHLVDQQHILRTPGSWVLPERYEGQELPRSIEDALRTSVDRLSPEAKALAEQISVCRESASIEVVRELHHGRGDVYGLLQELVEHGLVTLSDDVYRFASEPLREELERRLPEGERSSRHLEVGRALSIIPMETPESRLRAGEHLARGGDQRKGEALVLSAIDSFMLQAGSGLQEAAPVLEEILQARRDQGVPDTHSMRLLVPLSMVALSGDRRPTERHFERTFELLVHLTGMDVARSLQPNLGRRLGLALGVLWGWMRRLSLPIGQLLGSTERTFRAFFMCGAAGFSVSALALDPVAAGRIVRAMSPLSALSADNPGRLLLDIFRSMMHKLNGNFALGEDLDRGLLKRLRAPGSFSLLSPEQRQHFEAGLLTGLGHLAAYRQDGEALALADEVEALQVSGFGSSAASVRLAHYAYRGDAKGLRSERRRVDAHALQGGSTWKEDWLTPTVLMVAYSLTGDVVGLREISEQLAEFARDRHSLWPIASYARARHRLAQGKPDEALEIFDLLVAQNPPHSHPHWVSFRAGRAEALNRLSMHSEAARACTETMDSLEAEELRYAILTQAVERQLSLAEAGLGDFDAARLRLERLLDQNRSHENPLTQGLLHRDRASVALMVGDGSDFEHHLARMALEFAGTDNTVLVRHVEQLRERGLEAGLIRGERAGMTASGRPRPSSVAPSLRPGDDPAARIEARAALEVIAQRAGARHGSLFLLGQSGAMAAAHTSGHRVPDWLVTRADEFLTEHTGPQEDVTRTLTGELDPVSPEGARGTYLSEPGQPERYRPHVLRYTGRGRVEVVGVALLSGRDLRPLSQTFLDAVSRSLCEAVVARR